MQRRRHSFHLADIEAACLGSGHNSWCERYKTEAGGLLDSGAHFRWIGSLVSGPEAAVGMTVFGIGLNLSYQKSGSQMMDFEPGSGQGVKGYDEDVDQSMPYRVRTVSAPRYVRYGAFASKHCR